MVQAFAYADYSTQSLGPVNSGRSKFCQDPSLDTQARPCTFIVENRFLCMQIQCVEALDWEDPRSNLQITQWRNLWKSQLESAATSSEQLVASGFLNLPWTSEFCAATGTCNSISVKLCISHFSYIELQLGMAR
jgi:hypothetical protein